MTTEIDRRLAWQEAEKLFWQTRLEAKAAYKKWIAEKTTVLNSRSYYWHIMYNKAWQKHQEAAMALFLIECDEK